MPDFTVTDALFYSFVGFSIVFVVLVVLIGMIKLIQLFEGKSKKQAAPAPAAAEIPAPAAPKKAAEIPQSLSLGSIDLHTVDDRTAAMLMAIVANKMEVPLNRLRFISIREIEE